MKTLFRINLLLVLGLLLMAGSVFAAEGRIEITSPTGITTPGSYILVNDIKTSQGILIGASNVKLDLNGFTISRFGNARHGIIVPGNYQGEVIRNIEISNGTIQGFKDTGISVFTGTSPPGTSSNIRIHNLRIFDNGKTGISIQSRPGYIIENCIVTGNGGTNGTPMSGTGAGISVASAGLVINNVIGQNAGHGLQGDLAGYRSNVFFDNGLADVFAPSGNLGENLCSGAPCP